MNNFDSVEDWLDYMAAYDYDNKQPVDEEKEL